MICQAPYIENGGEDQPIKPTKYLMLVQKLRNCTSSLILPFLFPNFIDYVANCMFQQLIKLTYL